MIRIGQEALQRSEPTIAQVEQDKEKPAFETETVSTEHCDPDIGLPKIGRACTTLSSNTLCTHIPSSSAVAPSDQSIVTIQRSLTSSNEQPTRVPLDPYSSNGITHQCSCAVRLKSRAKENEFTAPTAIHIENASNSPNDPRSTVAQEPVLSPQALAGNVAQPLQLSERRERYNSDARIRDLLQQSREKIGNEMDTEWWLKLATWWFVKVGLTNGNNSVDISYGKGLLTCNSRVRSGGFWLLRVITKRKTTSRS